ncbi:hypothetical protein NL676_033603 [Syzygium grande]|nr:hypothetical protein NL676_033603 [Syzygium grande]
MDSKSVSDYGAAPRKVRFAPKAPPVRRPKPAVVKTEVRDEDDDEAKAKDLLRHFNEGILKEKPKIERKVAPSQIAFVYGGTSSSLKSYHAQRDQNNVNSYQGSTSDSKTYSSGPGLRGEKEYREPWDYYSYYPVTLPLRRPYSGNPEWNKTPKSSTSSEVLGSSEKSCSLDELSAGLMGKMLVYRSGAVKFKLGDTLYDVSSSLDCVFAQDVVAINKQRSTSVLLGSSISAPF